MRLETLVMSEEEVYNNTTIEPALQLISGEIILLFQKMELA